MNCFHGILSFYYPCKLECKAHPVKVVHVSAYEEKDNPSN